MNRTLYPMTNYGVGLVGVYWSGVTGSAAEAPASTTWRGDGVFSITKTATGTYTIVFEDAFRYPVLIRAWLEDADTPDTKMATIGTWDANDGTTSKIQAVITTWAEDQTSGVYAAANVNSRRICVQAVMKNSTVGV